MAILRGLLKNAPIRLFDEITGALDSLSASQVLTGIDTLTANTTRLMITHKLTEAQTADQIIVLADGAVLAQGSHNELLLTCSLYQTLWQEQTGHTPPVSPSPTPPNPTQTTAMNSLATQATLVATHHSSLITPKQTLSISINP